MSTRPGPTERQLRSFCLVYAILFICFAVLVGSMRYLIAQGAAPGETVAPLLVGQEVISAAVLVFLAVSLLRVRGSLRTPHWMRVGRTARISAITGAALTLVGLCAVIVVPLSGEVAAGKFPTVAVSVVTVFCAFFAYSGLSRLRH
jgi:hypothetical protein